MIYTSMMVRALLSGRMYRGYGDGDGQGMDGAPDVGTLGGTMADSYGETSATMGGGLSSEQSAANEGVNDNSFGYDFSAAGLTEPGSFSLGNLFGYDAPTGLATLSGPYAGNENSYGLSEFAESPFGKVARGLANFSPIGKAVNIGYGLSKGNFGQAVSGVVGGLPGSIAGMGVDAAMGKNVSGQAGSTVGGMVGNSMSPGLGGMVGSMAGGAMGSAVGRGGGTSGTTGAGMNGEGGFDFGGMASGLGGLYSAYQNNKSANEAAGVAQQQTQQLADMYGPNSPYAAQLRQQLERKDASGGRRSQYGPREVELQAKLADVASRNAPNTLAANQAAYNMRQNGMRSGGQGLSTALQLAKASGLTGYAQKQLGGMFDNWNNSGSGNGNGGYSSEGQSYNNPSAYTAPQAPTPDYFGTPERMLVADEGGDNYWDNW